MARTMRGTVISDRMDKTVVVAVATVKDHPIYKKKYKVTTKFMAHDDGNTCKVGDLVEISEARPISAHKRWRVDRKLSATDVETKA
jgi:small subunit ribosomal protein S17